MIYYWCTSDRYGRFKWLEFSVQKQSAFCFFCRNFGAVTSSAAAEPFGGHVSEAFSRTGCTNWKKALETKSGLPQHNESKAHVHAEQAYRNFITAKPVDVLLSDERQRQLSRRELTVKAKRKNFFGCTIFGTTWIAI